MAFSLSPQDIINKVLYYHSFNLIMTGSMLSIVLAWDRFSCALVEDTSFFGEHMVTCAGFRK